MTAYKVLARTKEGTLESPSKLPLCLVTTYAVGRECTAKVEGTKIFCCGDLEEAKSYANFCVKRCGTQRIEIWKVDATELNTIYRAPSVWAVYNTDELIQKNVTSVDLFLKKLVRFWINDGTNELDMGTVSDGAYSARSIRLKEKMIYANS